MSCIFYDSDRFSLIFGSEAELEFLVYFLWLGGSVAFQCPWGLGRVRPGVLASLSLTFSS